jgi:hypothetical protein
MLPRSFRGDGIPPGALYEYKPPSLLAQHKGLALLFVLLCLGLAVYCFTQPRATRFPPKQFVPAKPIYVEPIGEKDSTSH